MRRCWAGGDGGLCSHVFALLMVLEKYRCTEDAGALGPESVTSLPCSWGPRSRDVAPHPVMSVCVEKSKETERDHPLPAGSYEARGGQMKVLKKVTLIVSALHFQPTA